MYIDLFAGCGGLSLGLQKAGWKGLFAVEKNVDAFSTLDYNLKDHFEWPNWLPHSNLDINEILMQYKKELSSLEGKVTLVVGGPPCQGFSMAGKRTGTDARNRLYNAYIEFVELVQPNMLFFENVHGFTVGFKRKYKGEDTKGEPYSEKLVKKLKKMGYKVAYKVILVSDYGVPQKRKRFILFATKNGNPEDFFIRLDQNKEQFLKDKGISVPINVREAISDLQKKNGTVKHEDYPRFKFGKYGEIESSYQKLMRINISKDTYPDSHRFANQRTETTKVFKKLMKVSTQAIRITPKMNLVYGLKKRGVTPLKAECICPTITSIPDDLIHYSEARIMTVRENARIQSFPDDFIFLGKYTTGGSRRKLEVPRYTQVANAVPPLFAEQVGSVLMDFEK